MSNLTVSPEQMRAQALAFQDLSEDLTALKTAGEDSVTTLETSWVSDAATKFRTDWTDSGVPVLESTIELLDSIVLRLQETAQIYEDTDNELAGI